jgi:3-hydroxy acid dehydrogenase/malonic semialdehyde reductase
MKIDGLNCVITGASSGIGEACARLFAKAGASLMLVARRKNKLDELGLRLKGEFGAKVRTAVLDVRDRSAVEALFADGEAVDILVNNAGLARGMAPLQSGDIADWEEMIDTNIKGLLYVSRTILPAMVSRGRGHVINIGSIAGHETYPSGNVYCATKHAVTALGRAMGIDLLGTGVRVSSVDPGMVDTEFSKVRFHGDEDRASGVYVGLEPLHATDVAEAVLFCATRPPHANVREMILMPTAQVAAVHVVRK